MTAVETRYIAPTAHKGSRIKATALGTGHSLTMAWDYAEDSPANHSAAARALMLREGLTGQWHLGTGPNGTCVWVHENASPLEV